MGYTTERVYPFCALKRVFYIKEGEIMRLNGKDITLEKSVSVTQFLEENGYKITRVAIELNGEIIPKASYGEVMLKDSDTLEVVTFMGGG